MLWASFTTDCSDAVEQLAELLENGNSSIGELEISMKESGSFLDQLVEYLQKRRNLLCVRKISLEMEEAQPAPWIHRIVSQLKPGYLKTINLNKFDEIHLDDMEILGNSEQWKKAKKLEMPIVSMKLPYPKWAHLEFEQLTVEDLPVEAVRGIMDRFCRSPEWKSMTIMHNGRFDRATSNYFQQFGLRRQSFPQMVQNPFNDTETINVQVAVRQIVAHRNGVYKF